MAQPLNKYNIVQWFSSSSNLTLLCSKSLLIKAIRHVWMQAIKHHLNRHLEPSFEVCCSELFVTIKQFIFLVIDATHFYFVFEKHFQKLFCSTASRKFHVLSERNETARRINKSIVEYVAMKEKKKIVSFGWVEWTQQPTFANEFTQDIMYRKTLPCQLLLLCCFSDSDASSNCTNWTTFSSIYNFTQL